MIRFMAKKIKPKIKSQDIINWEDQIRAKWDNFYEGQYKTEFWNKDKKTHEIARIKADEEIDHIRKTRSR